MSEIPTNRWAVREIISAERKVLRRLCTGDTSARLDVLIRELATYGWRDAEHSVVFAAIRALAIRAAAGVPWRQELPAQATRMGFPDVEWPNYLDDLGVADESALSLDELISRLLRYAARTS